MTDILRALMATDESVARKISDAIVWNIASSYFEAIDASPQSEGEDWLPNFYERRTVRARIVRATRPIALGNA